MESLTEEEERELDRIIARSREKKIDLKGPKFAPMEYERQPRLDWGQRWK